MQLVWRLIQPAAPIQAQRQGEGRITVAADRRPDALEQAAFADEKVIASLAGKTPK